MWLASAPDMVEIAPQSLPPMPPPRPAAREAAPTPPHVHGTSYGGGGSDSHCGNDNLGGSVFVGRRRGFLLSNLGLDIVEDPGHAGARDKWRGLHVRAVVSHTGSRLPVVAMRK